MSPEWSQAFVSGVVPVYVGAPNVGAYALPAGWVDGRKFSSGADLWRYLASFDPDAPGADRGAVEVAYQRFFAWKEGASIAAVEDGPGELGTGDGVAEGACSFASIRAVETWPHPPSPGEPVAPEREGEALNAVAAGAWRCFRRALDRCVHYCECRICRFVHAAT